MDYASDILGIPISKQGRELLKAHDTFESIVRRMRAQLGPDKAHLDRYIITFLRMLDRNNALYVSDHAFHTVASGLRHLLSDYRRNPLERPAHPFSTKMIRCIKENPCPDERYFVEYYFVLLSTEYTLDALHSFAEACTERLSEMQGDHTLCSAAQALVEVLPDGNVSQLNTALMERFVKAPYATILLQTMADEVASAYLYYPLDDIGEAEGRPPDDTAPLLYTVMFDA